MLDLAAPIHGKDKDLLDGEDVRQHGRTRLLARSAVAGLVVLTLASSISALLAVQQRRVAQAERAVAEEQGRIALARQLAAQSSLVLRHNPDRLRWPYCWRWSQSTGTPCSKATRRCAPR